MRPPRFNRRDLLQGALSFVGGAATLSLVGGLPRLARATDHQDHAYIFCYFDGGWDLLLSLDPRDPSVFREDLRKVTRIQPGFEYLPSRYRSLVPTSVPEMTFGPCIGGLARHAERLCVVRGMSMDTLTHEVGRRRFITGRPPAGLQAKGSSIATLLAATLGEQQSIPQLSVKVESYNAGQPGFASAIRVNSVQDLVRALRASPDAVSAAEQQELDRLIETLMDCPGAARSPTLQAAREYRNSAQDLVSLGLDAQFNFGAQTDQMAALRDLYGIDVDELAAPPAQAAAAVTAITTGISRCVSIQAGLGLDTHGPEWASAHGSALERGFDVVAAMIDDLASRPYGDQGESWLDRTTILCFSEFGRSTLLNSSGGRDHFLHNACVMAGGGIAGGRVIGASSDVGMAPTSTDLSTGLSSQEGEVVKPEHIFRALLQGAGVEEDIAEYGVEGLEAIWG